LKKIGLISDTHIPSRAKAIPQKVFEIFTDASLIIHAGDLTELNVIHQLERLAPVIAVQGNMDTPEVKAKLPTINYAQVDHYKIGVVHSLGSFGTSRKMKKTAQTEKLNVLVSGHLHMPSITWENNTLLINPGSPTNPILPFLTKPTVATLKISPDHIEPEIIQIK
jgi:putative phosphoesterase